MYQGPVQQFPQPRRAGTGRTVLLTVVVTLGVYALVAGGVTAVIIGTGADTAEAGPEGLPSEPCSAAGRTQLDALSASMPSAPFAEPRSSCHRFVEYSDGTHGTLSVRYRFPTDEDDEPLRIESDGQDQYETEAEELLEGEASDYWTVEVLEARELELGDESVVSHHRAGAMT